MKERIIVKLIILLLLIQNTMAKTFVETIWDMNTILYGVVAGIAVLLITMHGIRWKIAENPDAREEAKRGILNVIFGLIIIAVAAELVRLIL